MFLRHGIFRPVDTVQNQLPEIRIANLSGYFKVPLSFSIDQKNMISAFIISSDIYVFAQFNISFRPQDIGPPVSLCGKPVRCKPVYPEVLGCPIISQKNRISEVFQFRILRMVVIPHLAILHFCIFYPAVI